MPPRPWPLLGLLLAACQAPVADTSGFSISTPVVTTTADASTSTSTSTADTTTSSTTDPAASSTSLAEPPRDLGSLPDFGDHVPLGCRGKIDLLFVISRQQHMAARQVQLTAAFPDFIETIESKFADFDYHIMVIDGDGPPPGAWWGDSTCNEVCPNLACKVGQPCCSINQADLVGMPCCSDPNYPCDKLDLVTQCDEAWGAGVVFPAGKYTTDDFCPIDGGLRYLVKGQTDLPGTFECIARVGNSGYGALAQSLVSAMSEDINDPGGCNRGFLRKDALLMVTLIDTNPDSDSDGTPSGWAQAVIDAKHGDAESVVMFDIGGGFPCKPYDRICLLAERFPYRHHIYAGISDWAPDFQKAAELVETACAGFTPPPA